MSNLGDLRREIRSRSSTSSSLSNQPASVVGAAQPSHIQIHLPTSLSTDIKPSRSANVSNSSRSRSDHNQSKAYDSHSASTSRSVSVRSAASSVTASVTSTSSDGSWNRVDADDFETPDPASRTRLEPARRHARPPKEAPSQPARQSPPQIPVVDRDDRQRRHASSRSHHHRSSRHRSESRRSPSDESVSIESLDGYHYPHEVPHAPPQSHPYAVPGYRNGPPPPPPSVPPSNFTTGMPPPLPPHLDPYAAQALVAMPQEPFGYGPSNPFAAPPPASNPFASHNGGHGANYFAPDPFNLHMPSHPPRPPGPPRPQSFAAPHSHYPGAEIMPYPQQMPYAQYAMAGAYPPWMYAAPPSAPERREEKKEEKKESKSVMPSAEFETIKAMIQKHEENRIAAEKERLAKAEAEAAAAAAKKAQEEAEKRKKEEIAEASKSAKEAAEKKAEEAAKKTKEENEAATKKAKEEHDKLLAEAKKVQEETETKRKALEEEIKKNKPKPDSLEPPIRFKDALGRKFSFPWAHCKTWKGMEGLIRQAFNKVEGFDEIVMAGEYDLVASDGEIILPQVWDTMIKPDADITMNLWREPANAAPPVKDKLASDAELLDSLGLGGLGLMDHMGPHAAARKSSKKGKESSKKKTSKPAVPDMLNFAGIPPPPTLHFPPGPILPGALPPHIYETMPAAVAEKVKKSSKSKSKSSKDVPTSLAWFAGGATRRKK